MLSFANEINVNDNNNHIVNSIRGNCVSHSHFILMFHLTASLKSSLQKYFDHKSALTGFQKVVLYFKIQIIYQILDLAFCFIFFIVGFFLYFNNCQKMLPQNANVKH